MKVSITNYKKLYTSLLLDSHKYYYLTGRFPEVPSQRHVDPAASGQRVDQQPPVRHVNEPVPSIVHVDRQHHGRYDDGEAQEEDESPRHEQRQQRAAALPTAVVEVLRTLIL